MILSLLELLPGGMAAVIKTFIAQNNFDKKVIIPFITHGGGCKYKIAEDI